MPKRIYCVCIICDKVFTGSDDYQKYCSESCRRIRTANASQKYDHVCDVCGKNFTHAWPNIKRCSKECSQKASKLYIKVVRVCARCSEPFDVYRYSDKEICNKCLEGKKKEVKKGMPSVAVDLSFRNKGILARPTNMWHVKGFSQELKNQIKERDGWECYICGKTTSLHVHHIIPRKEGGEHTPDNLVTLCGGCHRSIESGNMEKAIEKCIIRAMNNI